jgi:hypothetical protein
MKFFATSEIDKSVSKKLMPVQNEISREIIQVIDGKNYGSGIDNWGYIAICCTPELYKVGFFTERKYFSHKKRDLDMRLRIDYQAMLRAEEKDVFRLICNSILRSIDVAENELMIGRNKVHIKDFNFTSFRNDLIQLFNKNHWL